eukprot:TRINITY_DN12390_c0_g1_i1.p1 TRINITY_DN12390_c0_g1~~TRINITY_DN12390_c0_g1_i1.p1  ORF type:complete len:335 (-),score=6.61 TRINITY_DN12390_c0_g1_i1:253-1257(-)
MNTFGSLGLLLAVHVMACSGTCMTDIPLNFPNLQPESISYSDEHKAIFIGSMIFGDVHKVHLNGSVELFLSAPLQATGGILAVDEMDLLFIGNFNKSLITAWLSGASSFDGWQTSLVVANMSSGAVVANVDLSNVGSMVPLHLASDIAVDPETNDVYVTDTFGGQLWKVSSSTWSASSFVSSPSWKSPKGFGPNGISINRGTLLFTHVQKDLLFALPLHSPEDWQQVDFTYGLSGVLGPDGARFDRAGSKYYVCSNVANLIYKFADGSTSGNWTTLRLESIAMTPYATPTAVTFIGDQQWANAIPGFGNHPVYHLYKLDWLYYPPRSPVSPHHC